MTASWILTWLLIFGIGVISAAYGFLNDKLAWGGVWRGSAVCPTRSRHWQERNDAMRMMTVLRVFAWLCLLVTGVSAAIFGFMHGRLLWVVLGVVLLFVLEHTAAVWQQEVRS
jgi:hypothetical protein